MIRRTLAAVSFFLALGVAPAVALGDGQSPAAATLSRCLQTSGRLDVVFLMDESQSIPRTDPLAQRVDGIDAALAGFARLAETPVNGRTPTVNVLFTGFGGIVVPGPNTPSALSDWRAVNASTIDSVLSAANRYRSAENIEDTDYALALNGARTLLAREAVAQTESGGSPPCKALVWFTDGGYLVTDRDRSFNRYTYNGGAVADRGTPVNPPLPLAEPYAPHLALGTPGSGARMQAAGTQYLCRAGGVMDGLQSDGVVKFTFGLTRYISPQQEAFLEAATTGQGAGTSCGTTLSDKTGLYLPIAQNQCLLFLFSGLLDGTGCPAPKTPVCGKTACQRGLNAFRTISGLSGFLIRAVTGGDHINIDLRGPDGQHLTFTPGATGTQIGSGASITQQWFSSRAVEITGRLPQSRTSWAGPWSYAFVDPTGADPSAVPISQIELLAGLTPQLAPPRLIRGETTRLRVYFTDTTGHVVKRGPLLSDARPTAALIEPQSGSSAIAETLGPLQRDGSYALPITLPIGLTAPYVLLSVEVPFASATGAPIVPLRRTLELPVALPAGEGFPTVSPNMLALPSIAGHGTSTATVTVAAARNSGGCVWISPPALAAPSGTKSTSTAASPDATSQSTCVNLAAGHRTELRISYTVNGAGVGTGNASLAVHLHSDLAHSNATILLTGALELYPPRNIAKRVAILIVALLLGILIPLAILYLLNKRGARFTPGQSLLSLVLDLVVFPASRVEAPGGRAAAAPRLAFDWVSKSGPDRKQATTTLDLTPAARPDAVPMAVALRGIAARRPKDLFSGPSGEAIIPGHILLIGSARQITSSTGTTAAGVRLRLPGTWMFVVERVASSGDALSGAQLVEVHGRLLLLLSLSAGLTDGQELLDDAVQHLIGQDWSALIAAAGSEPHRGLLASIIARIGGTRSETSSDLLDDANWPATDDPDSEPALPETAAAGSPDTSGTADVDWSESGGAPDEQGPERHGGRHF